MGVIMKVDFEIEPKIKKGDFIRLSVDAFDFCIDGKDVPFDFEAYGFKFGPEQEYGTVLQYATGRGLIYDEYELADYYEEEWTELGLTRQDITAEFLSKVTYINEIQYECYTSEEMEKAQESLTMKVIQMSFEDKETGTVYLVDQNVIQKYNDGL